MSIKEEIINKYSFEDAKPFKKNTLDYVGVAFQFDNIVDFDDKQTEFYTKVKEILPFKNENTFSEGSLQITFSPDNSQFGFNQKNEKCIEYIYMDSREAPTIRVIINRKKIDFQCLCPKLNYENFDSFLKKIMEIFKKFKEVYSSSLNLMNLVLRKVNKIDVKFIDILNKELLCEKFLYNDSMDEATSYKEFISKDSSGATIEIRMGNIIFMNNTTPTKQIVLDFLIKQDNPNILKIDESYLEMTLKDYSRKIYNLYRYSVGESFVNAYLNKDT